LYTTTTDAYRWFTPILRGNAFGFAFIIALIVKRNVPNVKAVKAEYRPVTGENPGLQLELRHRSFVTAQFRLKLLNSRFVAKTECMVRRLVASEK
jgi:hypothetical protein